MKKGKEHHSIVLYFMLNLFNNIRNTKFNRYLKFEVLEQSQADFVTSHIHIFDFMPNLCTQDCFIFSSYFLITFIYFVITLKQ